MKISSCYTPNFHGFNVKFSPCVPELLACAASENYGLAGKGALFIITRSVEEDYCPSVKFECPAGIYNLSWSNHSANFIATCSGDGASQIWSTFNAKHPLTVFRGHSKEVHGIDWSPVSYNELILTASADSSIRLWDVNAACFCGSFDSHNGDVYSAVWCPHVLGVFASVGADSNLFIWDSRASSLLPQVISGSHNGDILTCDWNVLNPNIIVTGGIDSIIYVWDLRSAEIPLSTLVGHDLAVRRVKSSPFHRNVLASVSYDNTTRLWDLFTSEPSKIFNPHTEFVCGIDFSLQFYDKMADCGWDSTVQIYEDINFGYCL